MTPEVVVQLIGFTNAKDMWEATHDFFGVRSRAEEDFLRQTFQTTRKGNSNMEDYLRIMKTNADNLGQAESPIPRRALISQVLLGLDEVYNPVIVVIQGKPEISWLDMQSKLLIFEKRLKHQNSQKNIGNIVQNATINMAQSRNNNEPRGSENHQFHGNNRNNFQGHRGGSNNSRGCGRGRGSKSTCQVSGKYRHSAFICYNRFNKEFVSHIAQDREFPFATLFSSAQSVN